MWVVIARVKNEADIIEAFVRHSACHVDKLLVLDHASSDRTPAILSALVEEGLPLEVHHSDVFETQGAALTRLMRRAYSVFNADWVVPLDADEFIEVEDGSRLRDYDAATTGRTLELHWHNFMYVPANDADHDLFARMRHRSTTPSELPKVAVPRRIGSDPRTAIYEGNHFVTRDGEIRRGVPAHDLRLCHYPIRSLEQYRLKVITGYLRYIINPSRDEQTWGWHYEKAYSLILDDKLAELEALMSVESLRYSSKHPSDAAIEKPMLRLGGKLRYSQSDKDPSTVAVLARFSEMIARDLQATKGAERKRRATRGFFGWRKA